MKLRDLLLAGFTAVAIFGSTSVHSTAYVRIGGIAGDARDIVHKNWFEIISLDQGAHRWTQKDASIAYLPKESNSEGEGKITVTRYARNAIPDVYTACVNGTYISTVTLDVPVGKGRDDKYVKLTLSDVIISEVNLHRPEINRGVPIEQITMNFENARWDRPVLDSERKAPKPQKMRIPYRR